MSGIDNRTSDRKDTLNLLDYVVVDESGKELARAMARTLNVSEKGILLETHLPFDRGQKLLVTIGLEDNLFEFEGQVVHSEKMSEDKYNHGIEFLDVSEKGMEILQKFLKAFKDNQNS